MLTDCGVAFLKGAPSPLLFAPLALLPLLHVLSTGLGCTRGGGGRGGGTLRDCGASKGESSQFVVGVYRWEFPLGGGGAGAGLDGTAAHADDDDVDLCI